MSPDSTFRRWAQEPMTRRRSLARVARRPFSPVERLEERALMAVSLLNSYTGLGQAGWVPPDTNGAAGPTSYVETENQTLAIFTPKTTGTSSVSDTFTDFWFTQGGLARASSSSGLSDPIVIWDDQVNRFIVGDQDVDDTNHKDTFNIAVSKSDSPATLTSADWYFYQVDTTETGRNADYPGNFGYNHDAFVFTLNQNQAVSGAGSAAQVCSISINDLIAGNTITPHLSDFNGFSLRPTVMHDSVAGDPMWLLESTAGDGSTINVVKMTNVLSGSPTFNTTTLNVNAYKSVVQPLQPDGTGLAPASGNGALWTHILKAGEYNNNIVACDQIAVSSTEDDARWYRIDVSSGTPTIADQGNVSAGDKTYVVFPSIDINARGDIGMTYLQSGTGTGQYMSTYITGRTSTDAAGTMETPVLVQAGLTNNTNGREGDLSGITVDSTPLTVTTPSTQSAVEGASATFGLGSFDDTEGNFWAANEWASADTRFFSTTIAQFMLGSKGPWTVDVDWGDSTAHDSFNVASAGSLGTRSHTFREEGTRTVTVTVTDTSDNHSDSQTFQVLVSDPQVVASAVPVFATACSPLSNVPLATFTDPGGAEPNPADPNGGIADHYQVVSIDWGDGSPLDTSTGSISFSGSPGSTTDPFTVSGNHTYLSEGAYTIRVVIDHEGVQTVQTTSATVKDKLGLLLLDPTGSQSLAVSGKGHVTVTGDCGAIVVNSSAPADAAFVAGNGVVTAGDFDVTGGLATHGRVVVPATVDHEAPTPNPLGLGLPSPLPPPPVGNSTTVLNPGTYLGGLHLTGKSAVTLMPGLYVMEGGGFSVDGQASVTGSGVVIINVPASPSDSIRIDGQAVVNLSAPADGPYQGVAILQLSTTPVAFEGQAVLTVNGVIDTPQAPVSIAGQAVVTINPGQGTATTPPIAAALIAFDLDARGNGILTINPDGPTASTALAPATLHDAALESLINGSGWSAPGLQIAPQSLDNIFISIAGLTGPSTDLTSNAKKKP